MCVDTLCRMVLLQAHVQSVGGPCVACLLVGLSGLCVAITWLDWDGEGHSRHGGEKKCLNDIWRHRYMLAVRARDYLALQAPFVSKPPSYFATALGARL